MDSYIVRIYRRDSSDLQWVAGVVQTVGMDQQRVFVSWGELLDILSISGLGCQKAGKRVGSEMKTYAKSTGAPSGQVKSWSLTTICAWCKKVLDESGQRTGQDLYSISDQQNRFTHTICPECLCNIDSELYEDLIGRKAKDQDCK